MHSLAVALIESKQAMTEGARSALPDAPVVRYVEKTPVGWRTRATVARCHGPIRNGTPN